VAEEVPPRVDRLGGAGLDGQEHGFAVGRDAPGHEHRLGRGAGVHLEVAAVDVEVLDLDPREVAMAERLELFLDRLADPAHGRLGHSRPLAERLCQRRLMSRVDSPRT